MKTCLLEQKWKKVQMILKVYLEFKEIFFFHYLAMNLKSSDRNGSKARWNEENLVFSEYQLYTDILCPLWIFMLYN